MDKQAEFLGKANRIVGPAVFALALIACQPSEADEPVSPTPLISDSAVETVIAQTEAAAPTATDPPLPNRLTPQSKVTMHCPDCAAAGMLINLWDSPQPVSSGAKVQAQVPHGTICNVHDRGRSTITSPMWLAVVCGDLKIGWILEDLTK